MTENDEKIGQICEKLSKSKKFVKKHLFCQTRRNLVPINTTDSALISKWVNEKARHSSILLCKDSKDKVNSYAPS